MLRVRSPAVLRHALGEASTVLTPTNVKKVRKIDNQAILRMLSVRGFAAWSGVPLHVRDVGL